MRIKVTDINSGAVDYITVQQLVNWVNDDDLLVDLSMHSFAIVEDDNANETI